MKSAEPLPFVYEAPASLTRFTDGRDPKPRSREVFTFHRPETLREWLGQARRSAPALQTCPPLNPAGLRDCQITAITNLEASLKKDRPRALVQMATGSGKTFTAITEVYRLLKFAGAKRVLFLVDTRNLGEQAEQEFMAYIPNDDNRKFTELYTVQRLISSYVATDRPGLHLHHPAHVFDPEGRGAGRGRRGRATPPSHRPAARSRCRSSTTRNSRPSSSTSSSSTNATARSTTSGGRCSSTSTAS